MSRREPSFLALAGLLWEEFDDAYLVFNPLSDEIHRLNPLAAALLAEFEATALSPEEVATRIASLAGTPLDANSRRQAIGLIRQFDELGLIAPSITSASSDRG